MEPEIASAPSIGIPRRQTLLQAFVEPFGRRLEALFEEERDQLPLWLPVALGIGIAAWFWLPDDAAWKAFLLVSGAFVLAALAAGAATRWGRAIAIFSLATALGCALVWWRAERVSAPVLAYPKMVEFTAVVDEARPLPAREATRLLVRPADNSGLPPRVRINIDDKHMSPKIRPGTMIRLRSWLMPPAPMAVPGSYDFARYAWFQRIGATGKALDVQILDQGKRASWGARVGDWRNRLSAHIRSRLGESEGGIAAALATGDQGAVSEADADAMRQSGLAHLLSVSGLHLTAVVGAVMFLLLKMLALSPALALRWPLVVVAAAAGAAAGIAYTLFTGAEVPTVRACIAALLVLAAVALGREPLTLRLVAIGALVVLLLWPESLVGASFQLSFAAITAIVALHEHPRVRNLLARRDEGPLQRVSRLLLGLVLTGLIVEAALAPIALYHFHQAGLYGAFANVVAIPLTTFVIMPLELLAILLDPLGLGAPLWWLTGEALGLLLSLAHAIASMPGAVARLGSMPASAFALMVGGGLWIALWRTRWRLLGLIPISAGLLWALFTQSPDLIVTGDGRHLALRSADGTYSTLRPRAGDYVRDLLAESAGSGDELREIEALPEVRCSRDLCIAELQRGSRTWRVLATRSPHLVPWKEMVLACREADIVISDRRMPRGCFPRWLKADRAFLRRTGGLSLVLDGEPKIDTVAERVGHHPWVAMRE